ncbi:major facilitator superfamily domain-containing protein [Mycena galopus ATCC 62051]|nr:major facilitator superfamily domain-containing protein [Mycena galopus ATCC 62051]
MTPELPSTQASAMTSRTASLAAEDAHDKVATATEKVKRAKEDDEHIVPHNNIPLVFCALMLTSFLAALDQTIVATALPTIVAQLGGGKDYSWVGSAYLIAGAALCPAYGKLSDIFGRKQVLYPSILIFLVGSALCGAAKSMTWLILARALQGIGGGGIQQLVQVVIGDIVTLEERGTYGSFVGAMWGIAGVIGPLVGGALTQHVSWRWCFWINLPTGGLAGLLLFFFLNLNPHRGKTLGEHVREFDFLGLFLFVGGVVCLLLGFSQSQNGWDKPATIALLAAGCVALGLGVVVEMWTDRSPIIPPRLFKTRTTGLIFFTVFLHAFAFFSAAYYLPLYFQILGASATKSGVLIIPFSLLSSVTSGLGGYIVSRMGDYRPIMWISYAVMAIGYGLMIMLDERSSIALQIIYPAIAGIGLGGLFLPPLIGLQAAMPVKDMATSSTTFGLFRALGSTIGISVGQAIFTGVLSQRLSKISGLTLNLTGAALADSVRQIQTITPDSVKQQVLHAYTKGVSAIWLVCTPIICVCFVAVLFLKKYSLKRKIIRTGEKGPEVVPANDIPDDLEKGLEEEASAGEIQPST